jgi:hypothetical protein
MTSPAISVSDEAQVPALFPLIERKRLKRIPVVNRDGLVGLVLRTDVLRAIDDAGRAVAPRAGALTAQQFRELVAQRQAQEHAQRAQARRLAQEAQKKRIDELAQRRLSDRAWTDMNAGARRAASAGLKEYVLLRFPSQLCADGGRAINAPDSCWPQSLRGEPRDVFERWHLELEPGGFGLTAQIVSFPDGVPGDVALILSWGA